MPVSAATEEYRRRLSDWVIEEQRKDEKLTDRAFAAKLGISRTTLYYWRHKRFSKSLSLENIQAIAKYLGKTEDQVRNWLEGRTMQPAECHPSVQLVRSAPSEVLPHLLRAFAARLEEAPAKEFFFQESDALDLANDSMKQLVPVLAARYCEVQTATRTESNGRSVVKDFSFSALLQEAIEEVGGIDELVRRCSRFITPEGVIELLSQQRAPTWKELVSLANVIKNPATGKGDAQWLAEIVGVEILGRSNDSKNHTGNGSK